MRQHLFLQTLKHLLFKLTILIERMSSQLQTHWLKEPVLCKILENELVISGLLEVVGEWVDLLVTEVPIDRWLVSQEQVLVRVR